MISHNESKSRATTFLVVPDNGVRENNDEISQKKRQKNKIKYK